MNTTEYHKKNRHPSLEKYKTIGRDDKIVTKLFELSFITAVGFVNRSRKLRYYFDLPKKL